MCSKIVLGRTVCNCSSVVDSVLMLAISDCESENT
jgi:hypothetical protein